MDGNDLTLNGLPTELANTVSAYLSMNDLLSLRLVSRQWARNVVNRLAPLLRDRLRYLNVLVTKEGLQVLRGLTQISEFRREIENLSLVGYAQHMLSDSELRRKQVTFVASDELIEMFFDCFRRFERGDKLLSVSTGAWVDDHIDQQIGGLRPLVRSLGGNQVDLDYIKGFSANSWPPSASEASSIPLRVMRDVQMTSRLQRKIARLEIALFDDGWVPLGQPAGEPWQQLGQLRELDSKLIQSQHVAPLLTLNIVTMHKDARLFGDWT
jgi:hypothetical protein